MDLFPIHDKLRPRSAREKDLGQKGMVVWMTGLSGSGKSTIAQIVERQLSDNGHLVYILDGDNIRTGLNKDLGFSLEDRKENIRRISEVASLVADIGVICVCSFVSPTNEIRQQSREIIGDDYHLVFIDTPLEECEKRDVKGLYKKARRGEIKGFTGIDSPFEQPTNADLTVKTAGRDPEQSASDVISWIDQLQRKWSADTPS